MFLIKSGLLFLVLVIKCALCVENATTDVTTTEVTIITSDSNLNMLRAARDTYLEAYIDSHGGALPFTKKQINREENYQSVGDNYYPKPQNDYGPPIYTNHPPAETSLIYHQPKVVNYPSDTYGVPSGPSAPSGGPYPPSAGGGPYPPSASSGPYPPSILHTNYGPPPVPAWPAPVYGPPAPAPDYGPPSFIEVPHAMLGILDKFKLKLDFYTILKILLKVIIFKKIVKFMAILCLLLFIPYFKPKDDSDDMAAMMDDDERKSRNLVEISTKADERLNRLTSAVYDAISTYTGGSDIINNEKSTSCEGTFCRIQKVMDNVDKKYSFGRLFSMYYSSARAAT